MSREPLVNWDDVRANMKRGGAGPSNTLSYREGSLAGLDDRLQQQTDPSMQQMGYTKIGAPGGFLPDGRPVGIGARMALPHGTVIYDQAGQVLADRRLRGIRR